MKNGEQSQVAAPIPVLNEYFKNENKRLEFVNNIFNETAPDYNRVERILGFGSGPWYRRQALMRAGLKAGHKVLDVGTGTGLVATEALALVGEAGLITGVDPSPGMLAAATLPKEVKMLQGRAEEIPVADNDYDFPSMGYALRHISDLDAAFREFFRVLSPGGSFAILEITRPEGRISSFLLRAYMRGIVPTLSGLITGDKKTKTLMQFYWDTIEACMRPEQIMTLLRDAGFENVRRYVELGNYSEYQGNKPNAK